jgi:hypothetical protein
MIENQHTADLLERVASVDNKLERLLSSQLVIHKKPMDEPAEIPEVQDSKKVLSFSSKNNDMQEPHRFSASPQDSFPSRVAISVGEMDSIIQQVEKINHDAEMLDRVERLERQTRKTTILGSISMTLTLLTLGAFALLLFQVNLFGEGGFSPTKEKVAAVRPSLGEKPAAGEKLQPPAPLAAVDDLKSTKSIARADDAVVAKPAPPQPETKPAESSAPVKYVGFMASNKYHYPSCKWAAGIKHYSHRTFSSVHEAREKRYIPCPACQPPSSD